MSLIEDDLPNHTVASTLAELAGAVPDHPPRVLVLYGSLRDKSFSRFLAEECARVLTQFGAEVEIFRPNGAAGIRSHFR